MRRSVTIVAFAILLICELRLGGLEFGGPSHRTIDLPGGIPATFYLPGKDAFRSGAAKRGEQKPPVVVLIHGYSGDRHIMSALARRLAKNDYAVLAIDLRGHGANRNPFVRSELLLDVKSAVDFARASSYVDGSNLAVMGHSMGAAAALEYASRDPGVRGAVMISGGTRLEGPERPRNALFIFASGDPQRIKTSSTEIASYLAGVEHLEPAVIYGNVQHGTAVRLVEIPGADHVSIVFSEAAAETMVQWLDGVFGKTRTASLSLRDSRLRTATIGFIAFFVVLLGVGELVAGIAPRMEVAPGADGGWIRLAGLAAALLVTLPLVSTAIPASFIPLDLGDQVVSWLAISGAIILAGIAIRGGKLREAFSDLRTALSAAAAGFLAIYVLLAPLGVVFHRLTPTPARFAVLAACALMLSPFFLAFEMLVRRGAVVNSTIMGALGRIIVLAVLALAVSMEILPPVVALMLPTLAIQFAMFETFAAAAHSKGANLTSIAVVESAWLGWTLAVILPITI